MNLAEMQTEYKTLTDRVETIFASEPSDEKIDTSLQQEIITANKRREELEVEIKHASEMAGLRKQSSEQKSWLNQSAGTMRHQGGVGDVLSADGANVVGQAAYSATVADAFLGDSAFKSWYGGNVTAGITPSKEQQLKSPPVALPDFSLKTLVTSNTTDVGRYTNTTGGALVRPQYVDLVTLPFRPLKLREVVTVINATSPLIEYPRITGYTNNAAFVAEATDTSGSTGVKPESALALALATSVASTIAHWMPITRQALSDSSQLRDLINTFLGNGLDQALEDAMIAGNGTPPNMQGITTLSGTSTQAFVTNVLTTTRKALTKAQTTPIFVEPNAFVMSPQDWEAIDLSADNELRYFYGGPSQTGTPRLWGKPVIVSQACVTGTAWTGDLKQLVLADLQGATMYISDSHASFFIANLLAILMELRAHFFCLRPAAVIKVSMA